MHLVVLLPRILLLSPIKNDLPGLNFNSVLEFKSLMGKVTSFRWYWDDFQALNVSPNDLSYGDAPWESEFPCSSFEKKGRC